MAYGQWYFLWLGIKRNKPNLFCCCSRSTFLKAECCQPQPGHVSVKPLKIFRYLILGEVEGKWSLSHLTLSIAAWSPWLPCIHLCPAWAYQPFFSPVITVWSVTIFFVESSHPHNAIQESQANSAALLPVPEETRAVAISRLPLRRLVWKCFSCCVTLWIVLSALKQGCFSWKQSFTYS